MKSSPSPLTPSHSPPRPCLTSVPDPCPCPSGTPLTYPRPPHRNPPPLHPLPHSSNSCSAQLSTIFPWNEPNSRDDLSSMWNESINIHIFVLVVVVVSSPTKKGWNPYFKYLFSEMLLYYNSVKMTTNLFSIKYSKKYINNLIVSPVKFRRR